MKVAKLSLILFAFAAIIGLSACSDNPDLYKWGSSDHLFVASGSPENILASAGCTVADNTILLSPTLQKMVDREKDGEVIFNIKGVDLSSCIFAFDKRHTAVLAFNIIAQGDFQKWIKSLDEDLEYSEEDGYTIYKLDRQETLFIKNTCGVILFAPKGKKADLLALTEFKNRAAEAPLKVWQQSALQEGNAANMIINLEALMHDFDVDINDLMPFKLNYDIADVKNGYVVGTLSLNGLKAQLEYCLTSSAGKPIKGKITVPEIDTSLLKYASPTDIAVFMTGIPDNVNWKEIFNASMPGFTPYGTSASTLQTLSAIAEVLNNMEGTAMLAVGPLGNSGELDKLSSWSGVFGGHFKPGKAEEYFNQIGQMLPLLEQQFNKIEPEVSTHVVIKDKEVKISIPGEGDVYVTLDGDMLFASLRPLTATGGCTITASDFANDNAALIIKLPKENAFSEMLPIKFPFGVNFEYSADGTIVNVSADLTGTDGVFLDNIIKFVNDLSGLRY